MITSLNKLDIGSLTLHRYADLDYDEWYAMSEFVDNSLHSFMNNKAEKSVKLCSDFLSPEACRIRLDIYNLFPHLTCQTSPWTLRPVSPSPLKMYAYSQMSR